MKAITTGSVLEVNCRHFNHNFTVFVTRVTKTSIFTLSNEIAENRWRRVDGATPCDRFPVLFISVNQVENFLKDNGITEWNGGVKLSKNKNGKINAGSFRNKVDKSKTNYVYCLCKDNGIKIIDLRNKF